MMTFEEDAFIYSKTMKKYYDDKGIELEDWQKASILYKVNYNRFSEFKEYLESLIKTSKDENFIADIKTFFKQNDEYMDKFSNNHNRDYVYSVRCGNDEDVGDAIDMMFSDYDKVYKFAIDHCKEEKYANFKITKTIMMDNHINDWWEHTNEELTFDKDGKFVYPPQNDIMETTEDGEFYCYKGFLNKNFNVPHPFKKGDFCKCVKISPEKSLFLVMKESFNNEDNMYELDDNGLLVYRIDKESKDIEFIDSPVFPFFFDLVDIKTAPSSICFFC